MEKGEYQIIMGSYRTCVIVNELLSPKFHGLSPDLPLATPNPCKDYLNEIIMLVDPPCNNPVSFEQLQEQSAKRQQDILRAISTNLYGVEACVFLPHFDTSIYQQEDEDYHYAVVPEWEGKVLIEGLQNLLRYSGEDQWSSPTITLYWSRPNVFEIQENSKIVVHQGDQRVSLRSANRRRMMGQFIELYEVHELIPLN